MDKSFLADTKLAHLVKLGMDTTMGVFEAVFKFAIFLIVYLCLQSQDFCGWQASCLRYV